MEKRFEDIANDPAELERCKADPVYFTQTYCLDIPGMVLTTYDMVLKMRAWAEEFEREKWREFISRWLDSTPHQ